jgi:UDP-N-acetylglucosamine 2-epimerase (non-hydrolysing)
LFAPTDDAAYNLMRENVPGKIKVVGNVMIDSLCGILGSVEYSMIPVETNSILVTLHRPENVDDQDRLREIITQLDRICRKLGKVVFPCHPRTSNNLAAQGMVMTTFPWIRPPMGYTEFIKTMENAKLVITDSGGVQEESTFLGVPCITLRKSGTERPETVDYGTNMVLVDPLELWDTCASTLKSSRDNPASNYACSIPMWDGKTADRIVEYLKLNFAINCNN